MRNAETSINDVRLIQRLEDQTGVINSVAFYGNSLIASGSRLVDIDLFKFSIEKVLRRCSIRRRTSSTIYN